MGTASRTSSTVRDPRETWPGAQGQNIPEMFRTGRGNMAPSHQAPTHSSQPPSQPQNPSTLPPQPLPPHGGEEGIELRPHPPLNMQDPRSIADDIKETLSAAISELRLDLRSLNERVHVVEREAEKQESILQCVH